MKYDSRFSILDFIDLDELYISKNVSNHQKIEELNECLSKEIIIFDANSSIESDDKLRYILYKSRFKKYKKNYNEFVIVPSLSNPKWFIKNDRHIIKNHGNIIKPAKLLSKITWAIAKLLSNFNLFNIIFPYRVSFKSDYISKIISDYFGKELVLSIIYTGAPGKAQKFTAELNEGILKYYLKFSNLEIGKLKLLLESKAIKNLEVNEFSSFDRPLLINKMKYRDIFGLLYSNLLDGSQKINKSLTKYDYIFFKELSEDKYTEWISINDYFEQKLIDLNQYIQDIPIMSAIGSLQILISPSHGDYHLWNRFIFEDRLKIIDWENYDNRAQYYDLMCFLYHSLILVENKDVVYINDKISKIIKELNYHHLEMVSIYLVVNTIELLDHYKKNSANIKNIMIKKLIKLLSMQLDEMKIYYFNN